MEEHKIHRFIDTYSFCKDRLRQLSQDLNILNIKKPSKYAIRMLEHQIRFLIVSLHEGFLTKGFEIQQNIQQMTGCMGDLKQKHYQLVHQKNPEDQDKLLKNELEMLCYQLIATANNSVEL